MGSRRHAGDLDSIKPEVSRFYSEHSATVIDESHDQESTDLQKCIKHITERPRPPGAAAPIILAAGIRETLPFAVNSCALYTIPWCPMP